MIGVNMTEVEEAEIVTVVFDCHQVFKILVRKVLQRDGDIVGVE